MPLIVRRHPWEANYTWEQLDAALERYQLDYWSYFYWEESDSWTAHVKRPWEGADRSSNFVLYEYGFGLTEQIALAVAIHNARVHLVYHPQYGMRKLIRPGKPTGYRQPWWPPMSSIQETGCGISNEQELNS